MKNNIKEQSINYKYNIVDMHTIDCQKFLTMDNPDALVLSILCDFKNKNELDVLIYILKRLEELTEDDEHTFGKYTLILETLSSNRDLQNTLKKAEEMLRDVKMEDLPSYQIAMERGMTKGISQGIISTAIMMIKEFNLSVEQVAQKLNISIDELKKHLKT
jgi:predicted transposase/invertase (TIGR01784 family)